MFRSTIPIVAWYKGWLLQENSMYFGIVLSSSPSIMVDYFRRFNFAVYERKLLHFLIFLNIKLTVLLWPVICHYNEYDFVCVVSLYYTIRDTPLFYHIFYDQIWELDPTLITFIYFGKVNIDEILKIHGYNKKIVITTMKATMCIAKGYLIYGRNSTTRRINRLPLQIFKTRKMGKGVVSSRRHIDYYEGKTHNNLSQNIRKNKQQKLCQNLRDSTHQSTDERC